MKQMGLERKLGLPIALAFLFFTSSAKAQCGYRCIGGGGGGGGGGYATAPVYGHSWAQQQPQQPQFLPELQPQPVFTPQPQGYYYTSQNGGGGGGGYEQSPLDVISSDRESAPALLPVKVSTNEYEEMDKKVAELKAIPEEPTAAVESATIAPASTYIRESQSVYQPLATRISYRQPQPQPLPQQVACIPMIPTPYRPQPAPYMPRGYVTPYAPMPTYPPPPPPPPPPQPYPYPMTGGYMQQGYRPPINDCCGRCASICGPGGRRVLAQSAKTVKVGGKSKSASDTDSKDHRCTSKELKEVMNKISHRTPAVAKRLIQRIAEEKFGGFFSVFCTKDDFTYVSRGELYCQTENDGVVCYAFQHH